ncbi:MAG: lipoprotein insertase outer membrane protein LolB [Pseudomonadota bacterium]
MYAHAISLIRASKPAAWLAVALLAGCATTPKNAVDLPDISTWELRQQVLGDVEYWQFRGRIAVKAGDEGFNAKFNWTQNGENFDATVSGPLGVGKVLIEGDGNRIVLTDKDGEKMVLDNPEADLWYRYGWTIPVNSLRFWALGIPDPGVRAVTEFDEAGRLAHMEQSRWRVDISRYREAAGQIMPRTLTATNPDTRVRMVIDRWIFFER